MDFRKNKLAFGCSRDARRLYHLVEKNGYGFYWEALCDPSTHILITWGLMQKPPENYKKLVFCQRCESKWPKVGDVEAIAIK